MKMLDDLDNDGNIVMMREKSKNRTLESRSQIPSRMYQVKGDEIGEYEMLGYEGIDNDRDGLVNEDSDWDV
jgi:hypothetical protein